MTEPESRNARLLRELNEQAETVKGMTRAEKVAVGIMIGVAIAMTALVMWIL